jgi:predicted small lipoprotein YifL
MKKRIVILTLLAALLLLPACGKKAENAAPKADLAALYAELTALPDAPEMVPVSEKRMLNYYGIDPAACPQAMISRCSDGLRADEIWLVEAQNDEAARKIKELAEARVTLVAQETENYLPDQYAVVKQAKIIQNGSSVGLFISPQADKMAELFQAAFK